MASQLFIGLHGSEDPTKATFPFLMAGGALDAGHQAGIVLLGDAVVLMNSAVADSVQGVGFPYSLVFPLSVEDMGSEREFAGAGSKCSA